MTTFSDLLHVRIPNNYKINNTPNIPSINLINNHRINPNIKYRQHLFLRKPPPKSTKPPKLTNSYRLKQPNIPFPPTNNNKLIYILLTPNSFSTQKLNLFSF